LPYLLISYVPEWFLILKLLWSFGLRKGINRKIDPV